MTSFSSQDYYKANYVRYYVKPVLWRTRDDAVPWLEVPEPSGSRFRQTESYRYFRCQRISYLWDSDSGTFFASHGLDLGVRAEEYHELTGLSPDKQALR